MNNPLGPSELWAGKIPPMLRNRFFRGKFLDEGDLTAEQAYFLERHRLRGRMNGWGIVYGLHVESIDDRRCADRWIRITRGLAIDRCGREVGVSEDVWIDLVSEQKIDPTGRRETDPVPDEQSESRTEHEPPADGVYFVCLRHSEAGANPVPSLDSDSYDNASLMEDNFVSESHSLRVVPLNAMPAALWREPGGEIEDAAKEGPSEQQAGYPIPLAKLTISRSPSRANTEAGPDSAGGDTGRSPEEKETSVTVEIDDLGRPVFALNAQALTRIVETGWRHGETLSTGAETQWSKILRVRIDRSLHGECSIDDMVFGVTAISPDGTIRRLFGNLETPIDGDGRQVLVFHPSKESLSRSNADTLSGSTICVSIACDFLIDTNGFAVDGDHLGGRLPTGNGVAGGRFESWFKVA